MNIKKVLNKKSFILFFILFLSFFFSFAQWYFETRYFCKVDDYKISVALKQKGPSYKKCIKYLSSIKESLQKIETNLDEIWEYFKKGENLKYWQKVQKELIDRRERLKKLKNRILDSMSEFEKNLFSDLKKVLGYYFGKKLNNLQIKKTNIDNLFKKAIREWDIDKINYYIQKVDRINSQTVLVKNILNSDSLSEVMSLLKLYRSNY